MIRDSSCTYCDDGKLSPFGKQVWRCTGCKACINLSQAVAEDIKHETYAMFGSPEVRTL